MKKWLTALTAAFALATSAQAGVIVWSIGKGMAEFIYEYGPDSNNHTDQHEGCYSSPYYLALVFQKDVDDIKNELKNGAPFDFADPRILDLRGSQELEWAIIDPGRLNPGDMGPFPYYFSTPDNPIFDEDKESDGVLYYSLSTIFFVKLTDHGKDTLWYEDIRGLGWEDDEDAFYYQIFYHSYDNYTIFDDGTWLIEGVRPQWLEDKDVRIFEDDPNPYNPHDPFDYGWIVTVPEPATGFLVLGGVAMFLLRRRRK